MPKVALYAKWVDEEDIAHTWLLNAMKPESSNQFMRCESVEAVWQSFNCLHSKPEEGSRITDLATQATELKQDQR